MSVILAYCLVSSCCVWRDLSQKQKDAKKQIEQMFNDFRMAVENPTQQQLTRIINEIS
jgi:hypothetical protein